jgi:hypothetical protein
MQKQITVPLPVELVRFIEGAAQREDRSIAAQVRHYVAEAARQATEQQRTAA